MPVQALFFPAEAPIVDSLISGFDNVDLVFPPRQKIHFLSLGEDKEQRPQKRRVFREFFARHLLTVCPDF